MRRASLGYLVGRAAARSFFQHLPQIGILAASGFEVEDQILDAETKVIETFLKAADGLAETLVAGARFIGQFFQLLPLALGQGADLTHQFSQFRLELVLVHVYLSRFFLRESEQRSFHIHARVSIHLEADIAAAFLRVRGGYWTLPDEPALPDVAQRQHSPRPARQ
jgi:hypothetical protein